MIIIDPGHGGDDPGAVGNGIVEKDLNLKISEYMYNRFRELDADVVITRIGDVTLDPDARVSRILSEAGSDPNVILISNHINAGGGDGAEVIYALRNDDDLAEIISLEIEKSGQNIREWYQRRLPADPSKDYYFIIRDTEPLESVIVEYGFLDSPIDDVNQLLTNYEDYAEAVVKAVSEYKKIAYVPPTGVNVYVVSSEDNLYSIAREHNTTVDELIEINKLTSTLLSIGQILVIPSDIPEPEVPTDEVIYIVKAGDNLYSIARDYNVTVDEIKSANFLSSNLLNIGQKLIIPTKPIEYPSDIIVHTIVSGDNLYSLANRYNTSVEEIRAVNNLSTNLLSIGQELLIPVESTNLNYVVKAGDNLYSIAREYKTTVEEIKAANNLSTNLLSIGQELVIPT